MNDAFFYARVNLHTATDEKQTSTFILALPFATTFQPEPHHFPSQPDLCFNLMPFYSDRLPTSTLFQHNLNSNIRTGIFK